jgi:phage tail-like protein
VVDVAAPAEFIPFRFRVLLFSASGSSVSELRRQAPGSILCQGAFSELSGLEAVMTPKKVQEGGWNWGERLRAGTTTFQPITLKRGMTSLDDGWAWFDLVTRRANYALRLGGRIEVLDQNGQAPLLTWVLTNVLPLKFKGLTSTPPPTRWPWKSCRSPTRACT